ncbi:FAD-dependent oxidoreductase [Glycomyces halotolerans]
MSAVESADVVVIGAGIIGAACAEALSAAGLKVVVIDRAAPAEATTAAGEGNVVLSSAAPGPALELAAMSLRRWPELLDRLRAELGPELADVAWETKGGLVVATDQESVEPLRAQTAAHREAGVEATDLDPGQARELERRLSEDVAAAAHYPQEARLEPVLAATALLAAVRARGGEVHAGTTAEGLITDRAGAVIGVRTGTDGIPCRTVVNACGPWAGHFSELVGAPIDVEPSRGTVLETGPFPALVSRKVYDTGHIGAETGTATDLKTPAVVESTTAGTVLIGTSRQRVGFDDRLEVEVLKALARKAVRLFPVLAAAPVVRTYGGFRASTPDGLPVIGGDSRIPGLWHATGHEGAGVGLAAATGALLSDLVTGVEPAVDPSPFGVDRDRVRLEARA